MSNVLEQDGSWERIAAELRACKDAQRQAYGDVDNATLGRYLAGEMTAAEMATLEQTLEELPELRKLTDLVQDVLRDLEPVEMTPAAPPAPVVLPLTAARRPRRAVAWVRRYGPILAAACLLLTTTAFLPRPAFLGSSASQPVMMGAAKASRLEAGEAAGLEPRMLFLQLPPAGEAGDEHATAQAEAVVSARAADLSHEQLNQTVAFYHSRGEADKAEKALRHTYDCCKDQLGPDHKKTKWAGRQLAGVYQLALNKNTAQMTAKGDESKHGFAKMPRGPESPRMRAENSAAKVRQELLDRPTSQVVPVLTEALKNTNDADERLALIRALGELGPAARPAVEPLCERLQKSDDPSERLAVLVTLEQMGAAARDATRTLDALVPATPSESPSDTKKDLARFGEARKALTPTEVDLARQVLARLRDRSAQVGVVDTAGLFSVKGVIDGTRLLRELARESGIEVRLETSDQKSGRLPASALDRMGPLALHVVLNSSGQVANVFVSPALRERGVESDAVVAVLKQGTHEGQRDAVTALASAVGQVTGEPQRK